MLYSIDLDRQCGWREPIDDVPCRWTKDDRQFRLIALKFNKARIWTLKSRREMLPPLYPEIRRALIENEKRFTET